MSTVPLKECAFPACSHKFPEHYLSNTCAGMHVFLGGTCGNNNWREGFVSRLIERGVSSDSLFNPVVKDWNEEAQRNEDFAKENADYMLYYLGDPQQDDNRTSFYSLLEATMGLYDDPDRTVVVFDTKGMPKHAERSSMKAFEDLQKRFLGAHIFKTIMGAEDWLLARFRQADEHWLDSSDNN